MEMKRGWGERGGEGGKGGRGSIGGVPREDMLTGFSEGAGIALDQPASPNMPAYGS